MTTAIVTGSAGLIGSETARTLCGRSVTVVGIDNDMRRVFFGDEASTAGVREELRALRGYRHVDADIRDFAALERVFSEYGSDVELVVHTAAQPSHDWAARDPLLDFDVNATATLKLLELTRRHCPDAAFVYTSTNKVYGDTPNTLPLVERESRWDIDPSHPYAQGIPESMSIDQCLHSLFGASKAAADIAVQEYGRYFGMNTASFRCGCLTGPQHSGAELHGFLAYLMKCVCTGRKYTVFGYKGKQVRDNIHSADVVGAIMAFHEAPRTAAVYNLGGGRRSNCSVLEGAAIAAELSGKEPRLSFDETPRIGDHKWWISDTSDFERDYPNWTPAYGITETISEIVAAVQASRAGERV